VRTHGKPCLHSVVRLTRDIPEKGLTAGMIGTVVMIFDKPEVAYEIVFCDEEGRTIAELPLAEAQFQVVD